MDEEAQPWDRQPGERNLWYDRFERFRLMGPKRSLLACVNAERDSKGQKRTANAPQSWRRAYERWQWLARAEAWDQAERDRVAVEWRERQDQIRQADYKIGEDLRALARKILDQGSNYLKTTRRVVRGDDGTEREVVRVALPVDVAIKAADLASKLERQAAEMAPPRQSVEVTGEGGGPIRTVRELSDDELAAIAAGGSERAAAAQASP